MDSNVGYEAHVNNSIGNQRFYATARTTVANNSWRNKASLAALGTATVAFSFWNAKEVSHSSNYKDSEANQLAN